MIYNLHWITAIVLDNVHADWIIRIVHAMNVNMDTMDIRDVYPVFAITMVSRIEILVIRWSFSFIGSTTEVCHKETGTCLCKANFTGQTCEQCASGFFNHPLCEACACDPVGVIYDGLSFTSCFHSYWYDVLFQLVINVVNVIVNRISVADNVISVHQVRFCFNP